MNVRSIESATMPGRLYGLASVYWLFVLMLSLGMACSEDSTEPETNKHVVQNNLIFTRQDGTSMTMGTNYAICCSVWEAGHIDKNALKILYYDPISQQTAGWKLFILVDEASQDTTYALPTLAAGQAPISMFLADIPTGNELNSDQSESTGTFTIRSFNCGPPASVSLTIDATVASEFGNGPSVSVSGTFSCTVYSNPAPFGCQFSF
jgi:hypothetical protein